MPYENTGATLIGVPALSDDFRVNSHVDYSQEYPSVAILEDGTSIVVWRDQFGGDYNIYGRRFDHEGNAVGSEFAINAELSNGVGRPVVTALDGGGYVVSWESAVPYSGGGGWGVRARMFDANDLPTTGEFRVNTYEGYDQPTFWGDGQFDPEIAPLPNGGFVAVWYSEHQDGSRDGVFGQVFGAGGIPVGSEFQVNSEYRWDQNEASVAASSDGSFIVTWTSGDRQELTSQDGSGLGIYAQRFLANGTPAGAEFRVNDVTEGNQLSSSIAVFDDGRFIVTWKDEQDEISYIRARIYDANGVPEGSVFDVHSSTTWFSGTAKIVTRSDGSFFVAWESGLPSGANNISGQYFDALGNRFGGVIQVNAEREYVTHHIDLDLSMRPDGSIVAVWSSYGEDGDTWGIYGRRLGPGGLYGSEGADVIGADEGAPVWIFGEGGPDALTGGRRSDQLHGGAGNDNLSGQGGHDLLDGGTGADHMTGGIGNDTYQVDSRRDTVVENSGQGNDTIQATANFTLSANVENLILSGSAARGNGNDLNNTIRGSELANILRGEGGDDTLHGNEGDDRLYGGSGTDRLMGGAGNDAYYLDDPADAGDTIVELAGQGIDTVWAGFDFTLGANLDNLQLRYGDWAGTGNDLANIIRAGGGNNTLLGLAGNDTIYGGTGRDTLDGGVGDDRLFGGIGRDMLTGGGGNDRFVFDSAMELGAMLGDSDIVADFDRAEGDRIVLSDIDADSATEGDQAFALIGTAAFSGTAGELRYYFDGGRTVIEMDTNGDSVGDLFLRLEGEIDLVARDFIF